LQNGNPVLRRDSVWDVFSSGFTVLNILAPQYLFKSGASCHEAQHLLGIPKHQKTPLFKQDFRPSNHKKNPDPPPGEKPLNPFEKY